LQPALTWIDLTARDRDQMRRVLDLFSEQGTVDEMGLGVIRDAFADALFPGTSSIQTRLRYVLFVPWLYKRFEARRRPSTDIAREARDAEIALVNPLKESGDTEGIIGARAGRELSRLPSHVYWAGLVRWGVFQQPQSQSWYHTHFESLRKAAKDVGRADDPGVVWERKPVWHPRLPPPPNDFPAVVSFALTPTESDFVRGRFEEGCSGTLLAWFARSGSENLAESFWDDPVIGGAPENVRSVVELARRFSLHVEGLPLLYNLLLTQLRLERHGESEDEARVARYRAGIAEWAAREAAEALFAPQELWAFMARSRSNLTNPLRQFLESWSARLAEIGPANIAEDTELARLIRLREHRLKGARARFTNEGRLLDFTRGVGLGRMDFRWFRVRQLLIDLHRGFAA
jgi:hypothetical protein